MYTIDYHIHTKRSFDSESEPLQIIEAARKKNINEICFTDHCDLNYFHVQDYPPEIIYNDYRQAAKDLPEDIKVRFGIEIGQQTEYAEKSAEILSFPHFDFVIGSYHCMEGFKDFFEIEFSDYNPRMLIEIYFERLIYYVQKSDFNVLGHLTYPFRYAKQRSCDIKIDSFMYETELVFKKLIHCGKGIEINTSGLRGALQETMPPLRIAKLYRDLGGEIITVGSDAHTPGDVGAGCRQTVELLREAGFKYITTFEQRKAIQIPL